MPMRQNKEESYETLYCRNSRLFQPGNYQFRIELETEDGNILSEETEVILY